MDIKIIDDQIIEQEPAQKPNQKPNQKAVQRPAEKGTGRKPDTYRRKKDPVRMDLSRRPILSLLLGLSVLSAILLVTMLTASNTLNNTAKLNANPAGAGAQATAAPAAAGEEVLGVLTEVNPDKMQLTVYDVVNEVKAAFQYSGGTNITDKYGQQIAIGQIPIGTMVEGFHEPGKLKLTDLRISTKAWEYVGVNNLNVDRSARVMKIASNKYKFNDNLIILNGDQFIPVTDLAEQDELTVWGYDQTIWSIKVTRGHGTVRLADYDNFIGDFITIGYEAIQQIAKDMVITVREGNFNLTVENAKFTATKNITVKRDQETLVSLSDLGPDAAKVGRVSFEISPFGADLTIDGELMSYASPIELDYGQHNIEVSLGGYITYTGTLKVDTAGKTIRIDLPEQSSKDAATVSETDSGSDNEGSGNNGTDTSSNTGSTDNNEDTGAPSSIDTGDSENVSNDEFDKDTEHKIYIQNPTGASVYLNGEYMGKSPCSFNKLIGKHVLTFIKEGYDTMSYTVEVKDDNLDTYFNMPDLSRKK